MEQVIAPELANTLKNMTPYGAMVVIAIMYFVDKWGFFKKFKQQDDSRTKDRTEILERVNKMSLQMHDLHRWHDKEDSDGRKIWYISGSLEKAIIRLGDNIEKQTAVLTNLANETKNNADAIKHLEGSLNEKRN